METLGIFPQSARVDRGGHLWLGGCRASSLAQEFGTPLYVYDETTLRVRCLAHQAALAEHYPGQSQVAYAGKAGLNLALAQLFAQEGLGLDVVSGGELYLARQADFPPERIHFHGNNKTPAELAAALENKVGRVVVDNFYELELLERLAIERKLQVHIWLRLSPGIDVHTHTYRKTGLLDSKFGFSLETSGPDQLPEAIAGAGRDASSAERALATALSNPHLELVGLHTHIGSQVLDAEPFAAAVARLVEFAASKGGNYGFELRELSPGGGWGIPHHEDDAATLLDRYVATVCRAVVEACHCHGLALPKLVIEPGRSIVGPAGVALYRVGARKEIPGRRTYVSIDGGMADNIRPALYGARYTALAADKAHHPAQEVVTVAGSFCESGDVLIRDIALPRLEAGDLLVMPAVGAYCLSMASNYNLAPRPAVVLVNEGKASLIQRRETYPDLMTRDLPLSP